MDKRAVKFKIVIIGDSNTGKTCILKRYTENIFKENYITTIGVDFHSKTLKIKDTDVTLQLWDTAGTEKFRILTATYYKGARACLIIYDITRRESFENVREWCSQFNNSNDSPEHVIAIVGNKNDLESQRKVFRQEGEELAATLKCSFFESSAKDGGSKINEMFERIASDLINKFGLSGKPTKGQPTINVQHSKKDKKPCC